MQTDDPRIGQVLGGYRIEGLIARGGMGVVYLAVQARLDRRVALKVIAPEIAHDPGFRRRFEREWQAAAAIEHPNILPVYEAGEAGDTLFVAMRYVDGRDLRARLQEEGPLELRTALDLLGQVGDALDAAHERGLVHRDVKPANMLVDPKRGSRGSDHVYLADFGLARATAASQLTATGLFVGTCDYAAPEQIEGKPLSGRTDLYSLTCVLLEALTGRPPFARDDDLAVLFAHLQEPPPSISETGLGLPAALDDVIRTGMAKDPGARFASARELFEAASATVTERPRLGDRETVAQPATTIPPRVRESINNGDRVAGVAEVRPKATPATTVGDQPAIATQTERERPDIRPYVYPAGRPIVARRSKRAVGLIVASALFLIFSFLDWQQVCLGGLCGGISMWHGVGIIAGLLVIALLVWEVVRVLRPNIQLGGVSPGLVSVALALLLLLFTLTTFLTHNEARHWPSWIGFLLSIAIAAVALPRARATQPAEHWVGPRRLHQRRRRPVILLATLALALTGGGIAAALALSGPDTKPSTVPEGTSGTTAGGTTEPVTHVLGKSVDGRQIAAIEIGNPAATRKVLVFGCIHGNACAGIVIANLLSDAEPLSDVDLWIVPNLNPDGFAARPRKRQNADDVDLNRNFSLNWRFSEPEARIARDLIQQLRPEITIWFHQVRQGRQPLVDESGGNIAIEQRYAQLVGLQFCRDTRYRGSAASWQNSTIRDTTAFVVELGFGALSQGDAKRHADAVLELARNTPSATPESTEVASCGVQTWPAGRTGFTIVLTWFVDGSQGRVAADSFAKHALTTGLSRVGVLRSSIFSKYLQPGHWVVYSGAYQSQATAQTALAEAKAAGFTGARVGQVAR